jgi:ribosome maturation factor RimP
MAERSKNAQLVYDAIVEKVTAAGVDLIDVEYVREGPSTFLRIYIDKDGGVSLDDCTAVSHLVDPIIDDELKLTSHDYLEVSSPGLERPLKTDRDLVRYRGSRVEVSLYKALDGSKKFQGLLAPCTPEQIVLNQEDGSQLLFEREQVAKIKRIVRFDL